MRDSAAAISSAVGFVSGDSCQSRFSSGVMDVLESPSPKAADIAVELQLRHS